MRIGFDVRYLSHGLVGGVHNYVATLVSALVKAGPDHTFFLYADTKRPFELTGLPDNTCVRYLPYQNMVSSFYNDFFMKRVMERDNLDIVHFPANYGFGPRNAQTVITLHDQINILPWRKIIRGNPKDLKTIIMMTYLHLTSVRALRYADLVVTISDYSRSKIIENTDFDSQKIIAILYPPSPKFHRIENAETLEEVRQRHRLEKPFALADAIKNPAALVNAWKLLPADLKSRYQIVFFSRTPSPPAAVFEAQDAGYARLLVRPSNEDLMALYSMASAFAFPSWIEGLGLPLLEAMTCGAPVVASDRGSIPEVVGDAALITDVDDIKGFARNLSLVLGDPAEAERLRQRGFARAAQFSWEKTARCYLDLYQQLLASKS